MDELGAVVSRSLTQLIRSKPRPGWVRATALASEEASRRIIELQKLVDDQKATLEKVSLARPAGSGGLAQGNDPFVLSVNLTLRPEGRDWGNRTKSVVSRKVTVTWDELFGAFAPNLLVPARESQIRSDIVRSLRERVSPSVAKKYVGQEITLPKISDEDFYTVKVQFLALGLIEAVAALRVRKDGNTDREEEMLGFGLTPLGHRHLVRVKAIPRPAGSA